MDDTMQRRVYSLGLRFFLSVLPLLLAAPAVAQLPTTITISDPRGEVAELLRRGRQFEQQRRWGEALAHYEDAVRRHPSETSLQERFDSSRLHYDLERRHADASFRDMAARLSTERAINLYGQVLLKIEAHYVEIPNWRGLVDRGTNGLFLALGEPTFVDRNVPQRDRLSLDSFRREATNLIGSRLVATRDDARAAVADVARLAQRRLEMAPAVVVLEYLCGAATRWTRIPPT